MPQPILDAEQPVGRPIAIAGRLLLLIGLLSHGCGRGPGPTIPSVPDAPSETVTTLDLVRRASPWKNTKPTVKYVGDQACVGCHDWHVENFRQHPMGQSLAPPGGAASKEGFGAAQRNPFKVAGLEYVVEKRGDRLMHSERISTAEGHVLGSFESAISHSVGSGVSGRSYLIERDGFLLMSPITWYPRKQVWDLSPGYALRNQHFGRPILAECLFCHCNHAQHVGGTLNRYETPIFQGHAIGCERCHGPGELHVQLRKSEAKVEGADTSIVNPRKLSPDLREHVCQQCHLQGQHRVACRGADTFDYRPGLPLHAFISVFTRPPELTAESKFVGQVEQMQASACYQRGRGKLGCTSCHDPHFLPAEGQRVAYYRNRCLQCHQEPGCSVPASERVKTSAADSCIQCHMPVNEANITHTSYSDHRVPRRPQAEAAPTPQRLRSGQLPLIHFHRDQVTRDDPGVERDRAIAFLMMAESHPEPMQRELAALALPRLEKAIASHADDLPAREAHANALWTLGRREQAADLFETILTQFPKQESCLSSAASLALETRRHQAALKYFEQACALNPYRWRYRHGLGMVHAQTNDWNSALYECRQGLKLQPASSELRQLAVLCHLELRQTAEAEREFEVLLALEPARADTLKKWFANQLPVPRQSGTVP